jgi:hypothetical protein
MKKVSKLSVILYAVCVVAWTIRAISDVVCKTYNYSVFLFVLNILCAVIWIVAFIASLKRYRSDKTTQ